MTPTELAIEAHKVLTHLLLVSPSEAVMPAFMKFDKHMRDAGLLPVTKKPE